MGKLFWGGISSVNWGPPQRLASGNVGRDCPGMRLSPESSFQGVLAQNSLHLGLYMCSFFFLHIGSNNSGIPNSDFKLKSARGIQISYEEDVHSILTQGPR